MHKETGKSKNRAYAAKSLAKFLATASPEKLESYRRRKREYTKNWLNDPLHPERRVRNSESKKKWYNENRDSKLLSGRKYRDRIKAELGEVYFLKIRFQNYLRKARESGFPFPFSWDEFLEFISRPCFYCGVPRAGGIDRLDNEIHGYILENIMPCCAVCNRMKNAFPTREFLKKCHLIANRHPIK